MRLVHGRPVRSLLSGTMRRLSASLLPLLAAVLPAQEDAPDAGALLRELRRGDPGPDRRIAIVDELLEQGGSAVVRLHRLARRQLAGLDEDYHREAKEHLEHFARTAPRVVHERFGRGTEAELEEIRSSVLDRSRGEEELTKATIRSELDPALARLRELLVVTPEQVFAAGPELRAELVELERRIDELVEWRVILDRTVEVYGRTRRGRRDIERQDPPPSPSQYHCDLERRHRWLALLATPMSRRDRSVLEDNRGLAGELQEPEAAGITELNRIRILLDIGALVIDVKLCTAARGHSRDMRTLGFFSHTSPVPGKETPGKRAARAGTSGSTENIAHGQTTAEGVIRSWWYSPGHHRNMLGAHLRIGLGKDETHWTQMFGG